MPRRYDQHCALATALDLLGDRWTLLVLRELWSGPKRFGALERGLVDSPTNVLSDRLRGMTELGLINAHVPDDDRRGRVYEVSPEARSELGEILMALTRFGIAHMADDLVAGRPFHPDWLALPLEALVRREAVRHPVTVRFSTGDAASQFTISSRGVELDSEAEADVRVHGSPDALLRSLRSPHEIGTLVSGGELDITGEREAIGELQRAMAHPVPGA